MYFQFPPKLCGQEVSSVIVTEMEVQLKDHVNLQSSLIKSSSLTKREKENGVQIDQRTLPVILTSLVVVLLLGIQRCACQNDRLLYQTCRQQFRCGGSNIEFGYPFWADDRPQACGYPGFGLNCGGDAPLLNMPPLSYRVLDYNNSAQTVRVSRDDLRDTICPIFLFNTTLNFSLFDYFSTANDQNITLYYGCGLNQPPVIPTFTNQFNCNVNDTNSWSWFFTRDASGSGNGITCGNSIYVPVNQTAVRDLGDIATASITVLQSALASGFSIRWSAENDNCDACARSGGACGYNQKTASFACYCNDGLRDGSCVDSTPPGGGNGSKKGLSDLQKKYVIIVVSLGISGIVISSIVIFYAIKQRRLHEQEKSNQTVDKFLLTHGSLAPKRYNYKQIKKITKSFTHKLGQGGYGTVYKGKLPDDGQLVAVKVLTKTSDDNTEDFINEVASISRTSHVNIVNLLGFCYDREKRALVYEYMPNKSLDKFIHKSGPVDPDRPSLGWEKMYEIAVGVARGLEYLHRGCNTRIVHFDIKPQNILLDEEFCPKISDFGLAKLFKKKQSVLESMLGARGTIGYIAPEVFSRNFGVVSHKSDVYSYGMMLLEIGGARKFDETEATKSSENYFHDRIYEQVIIKNEGLDDLVSAEEEEEITVRKMLLVGLWCIQTAPSDRPSMTKVVEMLEGNHQSIPIPPKPFFSSPKLFKSQFSSTFAIDVETEVIV